MLTSSIDTEEVTSALVRSGMEISTLLSRDFGKVGGYLCSVEQAGRVSDRAVHIYMAHVDAREDRAKTAGRSCLCFT